MTMALQTPGLLSLAAGFTDNQSLPLESVRDVVDTFARGGDDRREVLQYGTNQGRSVLREALVQRLLALDGQSSSLLEAWTAATFITNGSQQALYMAVQALCDPGDVVLVDRPTYFVFLEMLKGLGVTVKTLPFLRPGRLDRARLPAYLDDLKASGLADRVKAIYLVSYFSNPSAASMPEDDKTFLAEALRAANLVVPVIEDAAYREMYFAEPYTARSTLALSAWADFPRLYTQTLTKPFATGLKVGYGICTHPEWLKRILHLKGHQDFGTANFNQAVLEHAVLHGEFERQIRRIRTVYGEKMAGLNAVLEPLRRLGWSWDVPTGGLYLWLRAPDALETGLESEFCRQCIKAGVLYVPGELCFGEDVPKNHVRLSFGVLSPESLQEAGRRFVGVAQRTPFVSGQ